MKIQNFAAPKIASVNFGYRDDMDDISSGVDMLQDSNQESTYAILLALEAIGKQIYAVTTKDTEKCKEKCETLSEIRHHYGKKNSCDYFMEGKR